MSDWLFPLLMSLVLVTLAVALLGRQSGRKPGSDRRNLRVLKGSAALLGGLSLLLMSLQGQG